MSYEVNDAIRKFLPPEIQTVEPLDYDWEEATNAVIFTSKFNPGSFKKWLKRLGEHYVETMGDASQVYLDEDGSVGYLAVLMTREKGVHPMSNINIDAHLSYTKKDKRGKNINAWIGSDRVKELIKKDKPKTVGIIRFRPDL